MKRNPLILAFGFICSLLLVSTGHAYLGFLTAIITPAAATPWQLASGASCFNGMITSLELARLNCGEAVQGFVEESAGEVPEFNLFPAEQLGPGELKYETLIRTGYPTAAFHDMGGGHTVTKSAWKNEIFECYPFGGMVQAIKHMADNNKRGGAAGLFAAEAAGMTKASMFAIAQQIYGGRTVGAKGFPGLKNFTAFGTTFTDPLTGKVYSLYINGSTGATAGTGSSIYMIRFNRNGPGQIPNGVTLTYGTGSVFNMEDPTIETMEDPNDATKKVRVYTSDLQGFAGLIIPNQHSVRRIGNLSSDSGKGLTDTLLGTAWESWPQGLKPDVILMSARSRRQLQVSRTVVLNGSGTTRPNQPAEAPVPVDYNGCPIVATDAIPDTDAIEVAAASEE